MYQIIGSVHERNEQLLLQNNYELLKKKIFRKNNNIHLTIKSFFKVFTENKLNPTQYNNKIFHNHNQTISSLLYNFRETYY